MGKASDTAKIPKQTAKMTSKDNKTYFVQKILDKRTRKVGNEDKIEYLLKWTTGSEDSWEPEENLNCAVLIRKYEYNLFYPGLRERLEAGKLKKQQAAEEEAAKNVQPSTSNQSEDKLPLKTEQSDKVTIEEPKAKEVVAKKGKSPSKASEKTEKVDSKKKLTSSENTNQSEDQLPLKIDENAEQSDKVTLDEPKTKEIVAKKRKTPTKASEKTEKVDTKKKFTSLENTEIEAKNTRSSKRLKK